MATSFLRPGPRGNRWLQLASSSPTNPQITLAQREIARRSDLIAWLALGLLGVLVIVSPIAIGDNVALLVFLCFLAIQLAAICLNRMGHTTLAGIALVVSISGAIFLYMWSSPLGVTMGQLPNYDALAAGVVIAASVLPRRAGFVVAGIQSVAIVADYTLRPHNANVIADAALYPSMTIQTISLLVRPIALQFIFAVIAFLWVRGTDRAIQRADRAEEIARLEYREIERNRTLEEGVRYLHQTLALWAQGNLAPRVPAMPLLVLEQLRVDLNTYVERFGPALQSAYSLQRVHEEIYYLTAALEQWVHGRPVVWPTLSGTPLDHAIELLHRAIGGTIGSSSANHYAPQHPPYSSYGPRGSGPTQPSGPSGPNRPSRSPSYESGPPKPFNAPGAPNPFPPHDQDGERKPPEAY